MPYRIRRGEGFGEAFQRILAEETARAADESLPLTQSPEEAIHQLRKRCKRVRGLIALYREVLGSAAVGANREIRDYARSLAGRRSEAALAEIASRFGLTDFHPATPIQGDPCPKEVARIVPLLTNVAASCGPSAMKTVRGDLIQGVRKIARLSRRAWKIAAASPTTNRLHRWRSRAKTHWYATRLTQDLGLEKTRPLRRELARLGEALGVHHDLSILRDRITVEGRSADDPDLRRIRKSRKRITRRVLKLGSRIYDK